MAKTAKELNWDTFEVHFFGGESFLAGDVVDVGRASRPDGGGTIRSHPAV